MTSCDEFRIEHRPMRIDRVFERNVTPRELRSMNSILAIGAHPDDIELGCGGALAAYRDAGAEIAMLVLSGGANGWGENARRIEQEEAAYHLGATLRWGRFADGAIPDGIATIQVIEQAIQDTRADLVFTHSLHDSHQDHRAAALAGRRH